MKKIIFLCLLMAIAISCTTENKKKVVEKPIPSEFSILGIKLGDSRRALMDSIQSKGYKYLEGTNRIAIAEKVRYRDYIYNELIFYIFDAKVCYIHLGLSSINKADVDSNYLDLKKAFKWIVFTDTLRNKEVKEKCTFDSLKTHNVCAQLRNEFYEERPMYGEYGFPRTIYYQDKGLKYPMKNYHQVSFEIFNNDYNEDDYSFFRW